MLHGLRRTMLLLDADAVRSMLAEAGDPLAGEPHEGAAAVALILRDGARGAELLLIRRAQREGDPWSGQMGLPGGRRDPSDRDLLQTAVRETQEEIGVDLAATAVLAGRLEDVEVVPRGAHGQGWIRPFVFVARRPLGPLQLAPREVDEVIWASLDELHTGERASTTTWSRDGMTMTFPAWDLDGRVVWGLTYRMVQSLIGRFGGALRG